MPAFLYIASANASADINKVRALRLAAKRYPSVEEVSTKDIKRWLKKAEAIQWDYKNIVKCKGKLERLK